MGLDELDRVARERIIGSPPHSFQNLGTLEKVNYLGTLGRLRYLGTMRFTGRIGTLARLGTARYVGTVNRLAGGYLGTVSRIESLRGLGFYGTVLRDRVPLGAGSEWFGSWLHVGSYKNKTYAFKFLGPGSFGSIAVMAGMTGTTAAGHTGTLLGPDGAQRRIFDRITFTDSIRYARPWFRKGGAGRGTVSVSFGGQP